jgi:hypothetical protein
LVTSILARPPSRYGDWRRRETLPNGHRTVHNPIAFLALGPVTRLQRQSVENGGIKAGERLDIGVSADIAFNNAAGEALADGLCAAPTAPGKITAHRVVLCRTIEGAEDNQAAGGLTAADETGDRTAQRGLDRLLCCRRAGERFPIGGAFGCDIEFDGLAE